MRPKTVAIISGSVLGFLAAWWAQRPPGLAKPSGVATGAADQAGPAHSAQGARFTWSQVESDDLSTLRQNLETVECPKPTTDDIIRSRVTEAYQARQAELFNPLARFWGAGGDAEARMKAARGERDALLASLGLASGEDAPGLPAEKQVYVAEALHQFPQNYPPPASGISEWAAAFQAREARVAYLSQYLTPGELLDYRILYDGTAVNVERAMQGVNLSDDEFKQVFQVLDGQDVSKLNGQLRPDLEAAVAAALGPAKYAEYAEQNTPDNTLVNNFASNAGLTPEQVQQFKALRSQEQTDGDAYRQALTGVLQQPVLVERVLSSPLLRRQLATAP